jgi:hypothetical protein
MTLIMVPKTRDVTHVANQMISMALTIIIPEAIGHLGF